MIMETFEKAESIVKNIREAERNLAHWKTILQEGQLSVRSHYGRYMDIPDELANEWSKITARYFTEIIQRYRGYLEEIIND